MASLVGITQIEVSFAEDCTVKWQQIKPLHLPHQHCSFVDWVYLSCTADWDDCCGSCVWHNEGFVMRAACPGKEACHKCLLVLSSIGRHWLQQGSSLRQIFVLYSCEDCHKAWNMIPEILYSCTALYWLWHWQNWGLHRTLCLVPPDAILASGFVAAFRLQCLVFFVATSCLWHLLQCLTSPVSFWSCNGWTWMKRDRGQSLFSAVYMAKLARKGKYLSDDLQGQAICKTLM